MKKILVAVSIILLGTMGAYALGTSAGTQIENSATLSYRAGGVPQPDVNTTVPDTFVVDRKIDMVLVTTDTDQIEVVPGQTNSITNYAFQNEGNSDQNFTFSVANLPNGGEADYNGDADNEDVSDFVISCTGGTPDPATSPADGTVTVLVAQDANLTCTVSTTIPSAPQGANGDIMNVELTATAVDVNGNNEAETAGVDTQNTVDIVFADGEADTTLGSSAAGKGDTAGDGKEVARSGYIIQAPVLSLIKTSCPISDPVNNTTNPKRIPGAVVRYMFDIENTGSAAVSDLNITDTFDNALDVTGTAATARKTESQAAACVCTTAGANDISGDTAVVGQDMRVENINVSAAPQGSQSHTCVSVETIIK